MSLDLGNDYKSIRNLANAINVVREGRIVKERDGAQFLDTDAQLVAVMYYQLQEMQEASTMEVSSEALPMVAKNQAGQNAMLSKIQGMLSQELDVELAGSVRKAS